MHSFSQTIDDGYRNAARSRTPLRRASCLLSTISVPFVNQRSSLSIDSRTHYKRQSSRPNGWPQWNEPDVIRSPRSEIMVQTPVHTSFEEQSREQQYATFTPNSATMAQTYSQAGSQSQLKPVPYHYQKKRSNDQSCQQGYTLASQRLRLDDSRSTQQLFFAEAQQSTSAQHLDGQLTLSPVWNHSIYSDNETYSQPYIGSSAMQRRIETTSSIGYVGSKAYRERFCSYELETPIHASFRKASEEDLDSMEEQGLEDYATWIKFESPVDLLSPSMSSGATSPSVTSTFSLESPADQTTATSIPMIREVSRSYFGGSSIDHTLEDETMESHSQLSYSETFGMSSASGIYIDKTFSFSLHPIEDASRTNQKSFRKKISQTFQDTLRNIKN